jgi:hypothetical protein
MVRKASSQDFSSYFAWKLSRIILVGTGHRRSWKVRIFTRSGSSRVAKQPVPLNETVRTNNRPSSHTQLFVLFAKECWRFAR